MTRHDINLRKHLRSADIDALRGTGHRLEPTEHYVKITDVDGEVFYAAHGDTIKCHVGDPTLDNYSVTSRQPSAQDVFGRACFHDLDDAVAYIIQTT